MVEPAGSIDSDSATTTTPTPLVSVITIFRNAPIPFFQEAVDSVLAQTESRWELLLVDDGSTDGSADFARQTAATDPDRIKLLRHPNGQHLGMSASRNRGIAAARGDFVAFLDADDVFLPEKLERQLMALSANPGAGIVFGPTPHWHSWTGDPRDQGHDHVRRTGAPPETLVPAPELVRAYLERRADTPATCGVLIRRTAIEAVGGFDASFLDLYEDQAFFFKLLLVEAAYVEARAWDRYRRHPQAMCEVRIREGVHTDDYSPTAPRGVFLAWLERHFAEAGIRDPGLRRLLRKELWPYRHRLQHQVLRALRSRLRSALPVTVKRAARRGLRRVAAARRRAATRQGPRPQRVATLDPGSRLRILIVSPDLPAPLDQGFRIRVHHLASALADHGHDVSLLAPTDGSVPVEGFADVEVIAVTERTGTRPTTWRWRLSKLVRGRPSEWLSHWVPALGMALDRLLTHRSFDIIQVEIPELVPVAADRGAYVVLDSHNIWSELGRRRRSLHPWSARRAIRSMLFWRDRAVERRAWRRADLCLATSAREEAVMRASGARVVTVPNGVEPATVVPLVDGTVDSTVAGPVNGTANGTADGKPYLVFVGVMSYEPNADAMLHMVRDILPLVRRERPDVELVVVGRGVSDELAALADGSVRFTGGVPDVRPYVAGAAVSVVPLRAGSGTRLKILEAMALGCPVVSTSVGAEGLNLVDGTQALIADEPEAFAAAVLSLLASPERAEAVGRAGRAVAESTYAWSVIGKQLAAHYEELSNGRDVGH